MCKCSMQVFAIHQHWKYSLLNYWPGALQQEHKDYVQDLRASTKETCAHFTMPL